MHVLRIILRVIGGAIGLVAGLAAILGPLLFIINEHAEMESAKQYGGHASLLGAIGAVTAILLFAGFFGLLSYMFIRYAVRGNDRK